MTGAPGQPPGAPAPREQVISLVPFVLRRRVTWGECDAAGVVYTPRFADFAADAGQLFIAHALGSADGYVAGKAAHGIGTPCKAMSFVFHRSLVPDQFFDIQVDVRRIGGKTFELALAGRNTDGEPVFDNTTTLIAVAHGSRTAVELPQSVRQCLAAHLRPST